MRNRPSNFEIQATLAAGVALPLEIPTPTEGGLQAVRMHRITCDEGLADTNARGIKDVRISVRHNQRGDVMQAGAFQTLGCEAGQDNGRNTLPLGYDVEPNDHMQLQVISKVGGKVQLRVERTLVFDAADPAIGGVDLPARR